MSGVGILDAFRMTPPPPPAPEDLDLADVVSITAAAPGPGLPVPQLASPFTTDNHLQAVVWADLVGTEAAPLTRAQAIGIPGLARQRHLICGTIARLPLLELTRDKVSATQPPWMHRTDGPLPPYHRMLWTVDDLLFYGWSLWAARRGTRGVLQDAGRVPWERWRTDEDGRILVDDKPVPADQVIVIPGPHEGILNMSPTALRQAIANANASANAARNPSAYLELHYTGDVDLTDAEIDALIARWAKARRGDNGGVAFTGKNLEVKEHGTHEAHLLIEGRNADAVDMSRLVSSPSAMADATTAGASLTYETTEGRNGQFIDYGVSLYMDPLAARLSMDDVVPRGRRVAFDTATIRDVAPAPTGPITED